LFATCFYAGFLFGLFSDPEGSGDTFFQKIGLLLIMLQKVELKAIGSSDYMAKLWLLS
jgi:hypothetical protein